MSRFDELSSPSINNVHAVQSGTAANDAASSLRLQYLLDNTPAIIYTSVPTGDFKMTFVSGNAYKVLGYHPEEMVADPNFWFNHIHPDDIPSIFSSLALLFTEGERTYEYRFLSQSGQYVWMHDMLHLVRDKDGLPIEVVGSLTDITQRKQMEEALHKKGQEQQLLIRRLQEAHEQLLQSEKMASVGQLAAGIAHEINNPVGFVNSNMGSLQNYMQTLFGLIAQYEQLFKRFPQQAELAPLIDALRKKADIDFMKEDAEALVEESMDGLKRVKDIVQSLKDFSHVGESDWQEADIHKGIESTLNIVMNEIKYKASIEKEYGEIPAVKCIISQLNQVFMNLLVNASHAIRNTGIIRISTGSTRDADARQWIWIRFSDTGAGIPAENLTRIFEPFFTTKPIGSGTGLGLSLSYGIIKKHGGRIEVDSEPEKGSTFTIHLPVQQNG
ncbi:ATP-binding protein [Undibacterium sp. TJN25]|uniref:ATP-binding protein n=1 Tax=Undibacterium sp. TJN25 TaxID=3413056 RepID=UPI003BF0DB76